MSSIFENCINLNSIPNIFYWNTINVKNMSSLFNGCKSLISIAKESSWKTKNVTNMRKNVLWL